MNAFLWRNVSITVCCVFFIYLFLLLYCKAKPSQAKSNQSFRFFSTIFFSPFFLQTVFFQKKVVNFSKRKSITKNQSHVEFFTCNFFGVIFFIYLSFYLMWLQRNKISEKCKNRTDWKFHFCLVEKKKKYEPNRKKIRVFVDPPPIKSISTANPKDWEKNP